MLHQQLHRTALAPTARRVLGANSLRGLGLTSCRETCFVTGYLVLSPLAGSTLRAQLQARGRDCSDVVTRTAGSIVAGIVAGVVSQPFDTVKTVVQSKIPADNASAVHTVRSMIAKDGVGALFRGLIPRGLRIVGAVVIMQEVNVRLGAVL
jgi:solute carrier family 25 (mitochondrial citrate transporter), member 1